MARHPGTRQNKQQLAMRAMVGLREIGQAVNTLAGQVATLMQGIVVIETILEVAGVMTPDILEKAKPLIQAKLRGPASRQTDAPQGGTAPAEAPAPAAEATEEKAA